MSAPRDEDGRLVITLRDVYTEVVAMKSSVEKMSGQGNLLVDHETRIRALERWRYALPITGLVALGSLAATIIGAISHG